MKIETFLKVFPKAGEIFPLLSDAMEEFKIVDLEDQASFLAQCGYESQAFTRMEENLNYSARRLCQVWPNRFTPATARLYANQPEKLANFVYANRMGNGGGTSGDGWTYRGRGFLMHTGLNEYMVLTQELNVALLQRPDLLLYPPIAARAAGSFWKRKCLNGTSFEDATHILNGGDTGYLDRLALFNKLLK